jgi:fumarate hydratase subunit alpha
MRTIKARLIQDTVSYLFLKANTIIRPDIKKALKKALKKEEKPLAKKALEMIIENADIAKRKKLPTCQDTGMPVVFCEIPQDIRIEGGDLNSAIIKGTKESYKNNAFRNSIIEDPILRKGLHKYGPPIIHAKLTKNKKMKITVLAKGFGSENKNQMKMFNPTAEKKDIERFILTCVTDAGPAACPPFILGIGIGGTSDKANTLAKEAFLLPVGSSNTKKHIAQMERDILKKVNQLGIGPMGFGGKTTCLGVNILTYPTHIAGLPVAVNVGCHATRSASKSI